MKKKIMIFGLKNNFITIFIFKLWLIWSNFYQSIERTFMKTDDSKIIRYNEYKMLDIDIEKTVKNSWKEYCDKFLNLYHWKRDKWYQLGDVISCPERVVVRKGVDCDDYSLLSVCFIPDFVNENGDVYEYESMKTIYWSDGRGHSIAVWKNVTRNKYLIVSNSEIIYTDNYIKYFENWVFDNNKYDIIRIISYDISHEGKLIFKGIDK